MQNRINGIKVGDHWCDDPVEVKVRVKEFFEGRIRGGKDNKLGLRLSL